MKNVLLLVCSLLGGVLSAAQPPSPELQPLNVQQLDPEWQELFDALQEPQSVRAVFVESRSFSFRNEPVILKGVIRLLRNQGVSLAYAPPEARTIIVDESGVQLRDARGRTRTAPSEAAAGTAPLLHVLQFDLEALAETFSVQGARQGDNWQLLFTAREDAPDRTPRRIQVNGQGDRVAGIRMEPTPRQRIDISIVETETDVDFSAEERRDYFR